MIPLLAHTAREKWSTCFESLRARLLRRFYQIFGEQLSFPCEGAGTRGVAGSGRAFRLFHEAVDLSDYVLLVG